MASVAVQKSVPTCPNHKVTEMSSYCKTCHLRVCEKCIKGKHSGHDMTNIKNYAKQLRMEGQQISDKLRREIIASLKAKGSRSEVEEEKVKVRDAQKRMKSLILGLIDQYADELVQQLENDEDIADREKCMDEFEKMASFFEKNVKTEHDNVVVEKGEELQAKLRQHEASQTKTHDIVRRFQEGTIIKDVIKAMLGYVVNDTYEQSSPKVNVTVERTIQRGSNPIVGISAVSEENAWIHSAKSQGTSLIDKSGTEIETNNYRTGFDHFIIQGEDQIFTLFNGKFVCRISNGKIKKICSTSPRHPTGICHARDDGLFVFLVDCPPSEITSSAKGEIHHMDMEGKIKTKYYQDKSNHTKLFTWPKGVAQNINSDLCVCDRLDREYRTRLVVVTEDSRVRFTYTGHTTLREQFTLGDVVCDSQGRIILSDLRNHAIHMLSDDGKFMQFLLTSRNGLRSPWSLALYGGSMWVGCEDGIIKMCKLMEKS